MTRPTKPDRPRSRRTEADRAGARAEQAARASAAAEHERVTDPEPLGGEVDLDRTLRPRTLDEFVGQDSLREQLRIAVEAARGRGEALDPDITGNLAAGYQAVMDGVRQQLGEERWAELTAKCQAMTPRQLAAYALDDEAG